MFHLLDYSYQGKGKSPLSSKMNKEKKFVINVWSCYKITMNWMWTRNYIIQMGLLHELEEINNKELSMKRNSEEFNHQWGVRKMCLVLEEQKNNPWWANGKYHLLVPFSRSEYRLDATSLNVEEDTTSTDKQSQNQNKHRHMEMFFSLRKT